MRGETHLLTGVATHLTVASLVPYPYGVISVGAVIAAITGALLPDIDHPGSAISRAIDPVSRGSRLIRLLLGVALLLLSFFFKLSSFFWFVGVVLVVLAVLPHRGITHSLLGCLLMSGAVLFFSGTSFAIPFFIGYASHLVLDLVSGGIPLWYPFKESRLSYFLGKTGGVADRVICGASLLVCVYIFQATYLAWF